MVRIKTGRMLGYWAASTLANKYDIRMEQARKLKCGQEITVSDLSADGMVRDGLVGADDIWVIAESAPTRTVFVGTGSDDNIKTNNE